jgi:hypothetical protein
MSQKNQKNKKKLYYFTLNENLEIKFEKFINENFIDKTKLIEGLIAEYLIKNNINLDD